MNLIAIFAVVGILSFGMFAFAEKQSIKFETDNLRVAGDFPVNNHPLIISGFDNLEKPYKLEIQTHKQKEDTTVLFPT